MKVTKIDSLPSIVKFKNKEDFTNRLIQQVVFICKNNSIFSTNNTRLNKLESYKQELVTKNEKINSLLEKSTTMKNLLQTEITETYEENKKFKERLLQRLNSNENY